MREMEAKLLAVLLTWAAGGKKTWQSLLQAVVNTIGIPAIVKAQMPAVEEALAEQFPNVKPATRTKIAKATLTRALQHIV